MNKDRREQLMSVECIIEEAKSHIQDVIDEEQDAFYNLPESFQDSERGWKMSEAIEDMEGLICELDNFIDKVSAVVNKYKPQKSKK